MGKLEVKAGGVPEGFYTLKFLGAEEGAHEEYGPRLSWKFTVVGSKYDGTETSRFTGAALRPGTACHDMACGIAGRRLELGDTFDPDEFVGKLYQGVVEVTQSGNSTRVAKVMPVQDDTPANAVEPDPF